MLRRALLILLALFLLAVTLVGLASWQFSRVVTPLVAAYLTRYGVSEFVIGDAHWHWRRVSLDSMAIGGELDGSRYRINLRTLSFGYHWRQLFSGKLSGVDIDRIEGTLEPGFQGQPGSESPSTILINSLLPVAWLSRLPLDRFAVANLDLQLLFPGDERLQVTSDELLLNPGRQLARARISLVPTISNQMSHPFPITPGTVVVLELQGDPIIPLSAAIRIADEAGELATLKLSLDVNHAGNRQHFGIEADLDLGASETVLTTLLTSIMAPPSKSPADSGDVLSTATAGTAVGNLKDLEGRLLLSFQGDIANRFSGDFQSWLNSLAFAGTTKMQLSIGAWPYFRLENIRGHLDTRFQGNLESTTVGLDEPAGIEALWHNLFLDSPSGRDQDRSELEQWLPLGQQVPVTLSLDSSNSLSRDSGGIRLPALTLRLAAGPGEHRTLINADIDTLAVNAAGTSFNTTLLAYLPVKAKPAIEIGASARLERHSGQDPRWNASGNLRSKPLATDTTFVSSLTDSGQFSLDSRSMLTSLPVLLKTVRQLVPLPLDVELVSGKGQLDYQVTGNIGVADSKESFLPVHQARVSLAELTGLVAGLGLQDGSAVASVKKERRWQSSAPWRLQAKSLETGVTFSDIDIRGQLLPSASLDASQWRINGFHAVSFGGSLDLEQPVTVALPLGETSFLLKLSDWQLAQVAALYKDQGLEGSGTLNGHIPISFSPEGLRVSDGMVQSRAPGGIIRFHSGASNSSLAATNEQLAMTLRLLEDFQYDQLSVAANFAPSGLLNLGLRLSGRNKKELDGRLVNFNINVEENLYDLLRTLQITDKVINTLEKRVNP